MRTHAAIVSAMLALILPAHASETPALRVTYLAGDSVYVGSGAEEGLGPGDRLEVVRDGAQVASLRVAEVSAHRSRCAAEDPAGDIRVGDVVRPGSETARTGTPAAPAAGPEPKPASASRPLGLRGRIGLRYLYIDRKSGIEGGYRQPALDLRLGGRELGGSPVGLEADVRARRTYRTDASGKTESEGRNRVYRLAATYGRPGDAFRFGLGRQFAPSLAVVSLFDGAYAEYRKERLAVGGFVGTEPDPVDWSYSSDVRDAGAFFEYGNAAAAGARWAITTGAVTSSQDGEINRDFVFVQGRFDDRKLSAYLAQEFDVNRGWRKTAEAGDTFTSTSTFASVRFRLGEPLAVRAGYDDRRSVRLYRDLVTPETEFDDAYRQGYWAGIEGKAGRHVLWGVDGRRSSGGAAGAADSYTGTVGLVQLTRLGLEVRERSTRYQSDTAEGWLHSLSVSADLATWTRLEIHGGLRTETALVSYIPQGDLNWFGLEWDAYLGRRWLFSLTADRNRGGDEDNDQYYANVSWRF
jgi:hypothetical protein